MVNYYILLLVKRLMLTTSTITIPDLHYNDVTNLNRNFIMEFGYTGSYVKVTITTQQQGYNSYPLYRTGMTQIQLNILYTVTAYK